MSRRSRADAPTGGNPRRDRVAHVLRQAIAEAIATDVKDPRVSKAEMLTVTRVEMNIDMAIANIYVSVVGDATDVIAGLRKAAGYLRGRVGRAAGLQRAPELRFVADHSIDMSERISEILREDADRARQAHRDLEPIDGVQSSSTQSDRVEHGQTFPDGDTKERA